METELSLARLELLRDVWTKTGNAHAVHTGSPTSIPEREPTCQGLQVSSSTLLRRLPLGEEAMLSMSLSWNVYTHTHTSAG